MIKSLLILLILSNLIAAFSSAIAGPLIIGNGGGASEFYLVYALQNVRMTLAHCTGESACAIGLSEPLERLIGQTAESLPHLEFVNSSVLGSRVSKIQGQVIFVNKDLLVVDEFSGARPWTYGEAVGFLAEHLATMASIPTGVGLLLKNRLAEFAEVQVHRTVMSDFELGQFSLVRFEAPYSALIIEDARLLENSNTFQIPLTTSFDCFNSTGVRSAMQSIKLVSSRWLAPLRRSGQAVLNIIGAIEYTCPESTGADSRFRSNLRVTIGVSPLDGDKGRVLMPATLTMNQEAIQQID